MTSRTDTQNNVQTSSTTQNGESEMTVLKNDTILIQFRSTTNSERRPSYTVPVKVRTIRRKNGKTVYICNPKSVISADTIAYLPELGLTSARKDWVFYADGTPRTRELTKYLHCYNVHADIEPADPAEVTALIAGLQKLADAAQQEQKNLKSELQNKVQTEKQYYALLYTHLINADYHSGTVAINGKSYESVNFPNGDQYLVRFSQKSEITERPEGNYRTVTHIAAEFQNGGPDNVRRQTDFVLPEESEYDAVAQQHAYIARYFEHSISRDIRNQLHQTAKETVS